MSRRDAERSRDGEVPVQTDGDEDERRQIEAEGAEEHEDTTGGVARPPGNRHRPADLERHHDERHEEVGDGKVNEEEVDARTRMTVSRERQEDGQISDGCDRAEDSVDDDRHEVFLGEGQIRRKAEVARRRKRVVRLREHDGVFLVDGTQPVGTCVDERRRA